MANPYLSYFQQLEQQRGLPTGTLTGMAGIESRFGKAPDRPGSQYNGMFQLGDAVRRKYGVTNPGDWQQSADGAAAYAADNASYLRKVLGRDPTASELYLAHQQGAGGAAKLLSNPNTPAGLLTNPDYIRSNGGDPNAPASAFIGKYDTKFNNFASGSGADAPSDDTKTPLQSTMVNQGEAAAQDGPWDKLGNFGNGLVGAGAALMAIDNPTGAAALAGIAKSNKDKPSWQYAGQTPNGNGFIMRNSQTGATRIDPVPEAYRGPKEKAKTAGQADFEYRKSLSPEDQKVWDAQHGTTPEAEADPEALKSFGQQFLLGDDKALTRFSEGNRLKAVQLAREEIGKVTGTVPTAADVMANRGRYAQLLSSERKFGQMIEPTQAAYKDLEASVATLKQAQKDLPPELANGSMPWNTFMQTSSKAFQEHGAGKLAAYKESIEAVARAYSQVLSRGATNSTVRSDDVARGLLNSTMSSDNVAHVADFMQQSGQRVVGSIRQGHEELRTEWKNGANEFGKGAAKAQNEAYSEAYKRAGVKDDTYNPNSPTGGATLQVPAQAPANPQDDPRARALEELRRRGKIK